MAACGAHRIPERPPRCRPASQRAHRRIMSEIDVAVMRVAFFSVKGQPRIGMLDSFCELTAVPSHWPGAVVRLKHDPGVVELARDPEEIRGGRLGLVEAASVNVEHAQVSDGRCDVSRALKPMRNLGGPLDGFARLQCGPSVNTHQSRAE